MKDRTSNTYTHEVVTVAAENAGERLDRFLAERVPHLSRSRLQALIRAGNVSKEGHAVAALGHRVKTGDTYTVRVPEPAPAASQAESMPLAVVHEDADLIVIDKPAGLAVHPGPGHA